MLTKLFVEGRHRIWDVEVAVRTAREPLWRRNLNFRPLKTNLSTFDICACAHWSFGNQKESFLWSKLEEHFSFEEFGNARVHFEVAWRTLKIIILISDKFTVCVKLRSGTRIPTIFSIMHANMRRFCSLIRVRTWSPMRNTNPRNLEDKFWYVTYTVLRYNSIFRPRFTFYKYYTVRNQGQHFRFPKVMAARKQPVVNMLDSWFVWFLWRKW